MVEQPRNGRLPVQSRPASTYKGRRKPGTAGYYRGVVDALRGLYALQAVVTTEYREILMCFDVAEVVHSAKRSGMLKRSGLREFLRSNEKS